MTAFAQAFEEVLGAAVAIDAQLRIVAMTPDAEALLGAPRVGTPLVQVLCGQAEKRPVAEALSRGAAVTAEVPRPGAEGEALVLRVRTIPRRRGGALVGHVVLLEATTAAEGSITRWGMTTAAPAMKALFRQIERVARRDSTVLVRGESGTGKELVARAVHDASPRRERPFRAVNCAALPPQLLESTLFGHVRGAFTGAVRDSLGLFRSAEGGTLFLDEIAELPLPTQAKLLRVLQERVVVPVGGHEPIAVDVRIASATHRALREEVREGRFREDLLYRVRVIPLRLPPLRERVGDVKLLAMRFAEGLTDETRRVTAIGDAALGLLERYDFPGNVRELANVIEYAFTMGEGPVLLESDLPPELRNADRLESVNVPEGGTTDGLDDQQRRLVRVLERTGGHRGRAAAILGLSRSTLWRRLKEIESLRDGTRGEKTLGELHADEHR
ncbi:MAG: sigma 54-interacting transcriptional regulator [Myxococcota bacterium]